MRIFAALGLLVLVGCDDVDLDTGGVEPIPFCPPGLFDQDFNTFNDPTNPGDHQNAGQFYDRDLGTLNEGPGIVPGFGYGRDTGGDSLFIGCEPTVAFD